MGKRIKAFAVVDYSPQSRLIDSTPFREAVTGCGCNHKEALNEACDMLLHAGWGIPERLYFEMLQCLANQSDEQGERSCFVTVFIR